MSACGPTAVYQTDANKRRLVTVIGKGLAQGQHGVVIATTPVRWGEMIVDLETEDDKEATNDTVYEYRIFP